MTYYKEYYKKNRRKSKMRNFSCIMCGKKVKSRIPQKKTCSKKCAKENHKLVVLNKNKENYYNNREEIIKRISKTERDRRRKENKGEPLRIRALKAWITRLEYPNQKYIKDLKELEKRLRELKKEVRKYDTILYTKIFT